MIELRLVGRLAKEFMPKVMLEVSSIPEAVRALCIQIPGFEESLRRGSYRVTRVSASGASTDVDETSLPLALGRTKIVYIRPVIKGNKRGGLGKVLLGAVLIGAAFLIPGSAGLAGKAAMGATMGGSGLTYGYLASMGALMMLNGVSQMLSPQPGSSNREEANSHLIDATGNRTEQGGAVPIVYGEAFTGSTVVSAGITVEEFPIPGKNEEDTVLPTEFSPDPNAV